MDESYTIYRTAELRAAGWSKTQLRNAVASGALIRVRRGQYVQATCPSSCREAARLGGRLDCVSAVKAYGAFVLERLPIHVQLKPTASRVPPAAHAVRHWRESDAPEHAAIVPPVEALRQAVACMQNAYAIVAMLDSALHIGLLSVAQVGEVFAGMPRRKRRLIFRLNRTAESGSESIVRMLLEELGCEVDVQVRFSGIGRVDLVVDGWLVIECDSREHHSSPEQQVRDRRRDRMLAARGYVTLRLIAEEVFYDIDAVRAALRGILRSRRSASRHPLRRPLELGRAA